MSVQFPPFVIKRPDGFVGVELSIEDQLTIEEARALAVQLLVTARQAELDADRPRADAPAWLVWERATDGGRPFLRAIDFSEERAERHVAYIKGEAPYFRPPKPPPDLVIEETRLNHLYAADLLTALQLQRTKAKP